MGIVTNLFKGLFGGGSSMPPTPTIPKAPAPPPTAVDPAVVAARQSALTSGAAAYGSDIATSAQGDSAAANTAKKTALGS